MKFAAFVALLILLPFSCSLSNSTNEKILSRKRRYLVFPEGSSLQLVYCLTMPSLGMGRIFTIGSTAAMAWILPHEPMVFLDKKNKKKEQPPEHNEVNELDFVSYDPHQHYSDQEDKYYNFENYERIGRPGMNYFPRNEHYETFSKHPVEPHHWHLYRRSRRSLYGKLEKLLTALNTDGPACILKMICEVSQMANRKGSFMEEIIKVIFRIKSHRMINEDKYDEAYNKNHDCQERYKACPGTLSGRL